MPINLPIDAITSRLNLQGRFDNVRSQSVTSRFANLKPISEFFNFKQISKPANFGEVQNRVNYNLGYFSSNYAVLFVMLSIYTLITNWLLTFVILLVVGGMYGIGKLEGRDVEIGNFRATTSQLYTALVVIAVPLAIFSNPFGSALWLIGASGVSIIGHAAFLEKPIEGGGLNGRPRAPHDMPQWGRPSGALVGGREEGWRDEYETRRRRFLTVDDESDDGHQRVYLDPAGFKSRSADRLPREGYTGDELLFTGYDLGSGRGERRVDDIPYERRAYQPRDDELYHDNALTRPSREDALVQSARDKLRRARVKGKTNVSLSVEEMAALERSSTQQRDTSEPNTPNKSKSRGSRSSSTTSLTSTRPRRQSISLFGSTSPSQSRSRTPKTTRKASNEQQPVIRPSGSTPPAFMIHGPDGVPMHAPMGYYPSPVSSRRPSSNSNRQITPPYEAYSPRVYGPELRTHSSPSNRALYNENAWASSSRQAPSASYPDLSEPSASAGNSYPTALPVSDVSYAKLRRGPQGSPLSNVEAAADRWEREAALGQRARPPSSGSSSDDSGQGVRIEVEPGFGFRRVPVSSKSSGTVRRKGRR
ncbi:hypothetical protein E4T38_07751 [Aureobasidium subglaciale]|nr:hypothetical protein E4T38_07751 [Aureobasidium subglaciale]KAI5216776.1 hypothetical protein E4T40_07761 [Aureobasidium subglaciale]KAI5220035.1 hypothetical protein E4T41_07676 [Aureobasidium subglaciale]KAI5257867.1 hypothetical protein E4T46_07652 [Aureobasidium subglaciale]